MKTTTKVSKFDPNSYELTVTVEDIVVFSGVFEDWNGQLAMVDLDGNVQATYTPSQRLRFLPILQSELTA